MKCIIALQDSPLQDTANLTRYRSSVEALQDLGRVPTCSQNNSQTPGLAKHHCDCRSHHGEAIRSSSIWFLSTAWHASSQDASLPDCTLLMRHSSSSGLLKQVPHSLPSPLPPPPCTLHTLSRSLMQDLEVVYLSCYFD